MRSAGTSIHSSSQGQGSPVDSGAVRPSPSASGCEVMIMVRKKPCASTVETFYLDNVGISYQSTTTQPVLVKAGYRYGFNGQEKDNEVMGEGNSYTAEFWNYDARLGRRWNVDPKSHASISCYSTFSNNPICYSDPKGDTVVINLFSRITKDLLGYSYAETFLKDKKNQPNDDLFLVFGHGNSRFMGYSDNEGYSREIHTSEDFNRMMSERSSEFQSALEEGRPVVVVLFTCNAASESYYTSFGEHKESSYTIAEKIADGLPNGSVVVAPDGYTVYRAVDGVPKMVGVYDRSEEDGRSSNKGGFSFIKKSSKQVGKMRMSYDPENCKTTIGPFKK
jgi:RHS repeat-associated protein